MSRPIVPSATGADIAGDCNTPGNMIISLVGPASRQLVGPAGGRINYTITGLPISMPKPGNAPPGNPGNGFVPWFVHGQLQGFVEGSAYADAPAGAYSDLVTISITP